MYWALATNCQAWRAAKEVFHSATCVLRLSGCTEPKLPNHRLVSSAGMELLWTNRNTKFLAVIMFFSWHLCFLYSICSSMLYIFCIDDWVRSDRQKNIDRKTMIAQESDSALSMLILQSLLTRLMHPAPSSLCIGSIYLHPSS